jgi:hypothetical protein
MIRASVTTEKELTAAVLMASAALGSFRVYAGTLEVTRTW